MKKNQLYHIVSFLFFTFIVPTMAVASGYISVDTEDDLPRVSKNIQHFLVNEEQSIKHIKVAEDFTEDLCMQIVRGGSFLMNDFAFNPTAFRIELRKTLKYVVDNKFLINQKIEKKELDNLFLYGLWVVHNVLSHVK